MSAQSQLPIGRRKGRFIRLETGKLIRLMCPLLALALESSARGREGEKRDSKRDGHTARDRETERDRQRERVSPLLSVNRTGCLGAQHLFSGS